MNVNGINVEGIVRIGNARVYGLNESMIANGYPMQTEYCEDMDQYIFGDKDFKRSAHLGNAEPGSGHDCFLKGIQVQFDLQAPEYIWRQLDRYHFIDYVSSQSKMHRILKMDLDATCNKYVSDEALVNVKKFIVQYNEFEWFYKMFCKDHELECKEKGIIVDPNWEPKLTLRNGEQVDYTKENLFKIIIANCPCGLMLTARMTTNYLQLKSIINQRSNHKMQEWHYITEWMKGLPYMQELVLKNK